MIALARTTTNTDKVTANVENLFSKLQTNFSLSENITPQSLAEVFNVEVSDLENNFNFDKLGRVQAALQVFANKCFRDNMENVPDILYCVSWEPPDGIVFTMGDNSHVVATSSQPSGCGELTWNKDNIVAAFLENVKN